VLDGALPSLSGGERMLWDLLSRQQISGLNSAPPVVHTVATSLLDLKKIPEAPHVVAVVHFIRALARLGRNCTWWIFGIFVKVLQAGIWRQKITTVWQALSENTTIYHLALPDNCCADARDSFFPSICRAFYARGVAHDFGESFSINDPYREKSRLGRILTAVQLPPCQASLRDTVGSCHGEKRGIGIGPAEELSLVADSYPSRFVILPILEPFQEGIMITSQDNLYLGNKRQAVIQQWMQLFHSGILSRMDARAERPRMWWGNFPRRLSLSGNPALATIFVVSLSGCGLSLLLFLIENIVGRVRSRGAGYMKKQRHKLAVPTPTRSVRVNVASNYAPRVACGLNSAGSHFCDEDNEDPVGMDPPPIQ